MQEASEEEDPNMQDDNYFKKEKKRVPIPFDSGPAPAGHHSALKERKVSENELGYLQTLNVEGQFDFINQIGNDVGDFLFDSDAKREKEDVALENADLFVQAMRGEFFIDEEVQVRCKGDQFALLGADRVLSEGELMDKLQRDESLDARQKSRILQMSKRRTLILRQNEKRNQAMTFGSNSLSD